MPMICIHSSLPSRFVQMLPSQWDVLWPSLYNSSLAFFIFLYNIITTWYFTICLFILIIAYFSSLQIWSLLEEGSKTYQMWSLRFSLGLCPLALSIGTLSHRSKKGVSNPKKTFTWIKAIKKQSAKGSWPSPLDWQKVRGATRLRQPGFYKIRNSFDVSAAPELNCFKVQLGFS